MSSRRALYEECEQIAAQIRDLMADHPGFMLTSDGAYIMVGVYGRYSSDVVEVRV